MARAAATFRRDYLSTRGWTRASAVYTGSLSTEIYMPNVAGRPVLGIIPGGGWTTASRLNATTAYVATRFADMGFCVFVLDTTQADVDPGTSVDPQTPITDTLAFVSWARTNAATYNGLANNIALLGMSSGGHLALMAAIQGVAGESRPDAVVAWSPATNLGTLTSPGSTYALDYMNVAFSGNEAAWNAKSPALAVTSNSCPIRIVGASADPNGIAQAQFDSMHTAALAAGVDSTKKIYTGTTHAVDFGSARRYMASDDDVNETAAWLAEHLPWTRVATPRTATSRSVASRSAV